MPEWNDWDLDEGDTALDERSKLELPAASQLLSKGGGSEIEDRQVIPSFLDRLEHAVDLQMDLASPEIAEVVPAEDSVAFAIHHQIEHGPALDLIRGSERYTVLIQSGWINRIWMRMQGFEKGNQSLISTGYPLPIAEVHSPHRAGCRSRFRSEQQYSSKSGVKIFARGMGAGGGLAARVRIKQEISVTEGCIQATVPADISVVPWTNMTTGDIVYDVRVSNIDDSWSPTEIPPWRRHPCGTNYRALLQSKRVEEAKGWIARGVDYFTHDVSVPGAAVKKAWSVHRERYFNLDVGGVVAISSQLSEGYEYEYELYPMTECVGYFEGPDSEVVWWAWKDEPR